MYCLGERKSIPRGFESDESLLTVESSVCDSLVGPRNSALELDNTATEVAQCAASVIVLYARMGRFYLLTGNICQGAKNGSTH